MDNAKTPASPRSLKRLVLWQYRVEYVSGGPMPARELNKYGEDGWELCGIASAAIPSRSMSNAWPDVMAYTFKMQQSQNDKMSGRGEETK